MQLVEPHKVSIIMPTYNRAAYIVETIESILAQTYRNWELLVMDDGSEDDTLEVLSNIRDERITVLQCGRIGISGTVKNMGIRKATGDLIAFMDSDDLWPPDKLEKQIAALLACPKARFSFTNGFDFREKEIPTSFFYEQVNGTGCKQIFPAYCKGEIAVRTPTVMFWKDGLQTTGMFNEDRIFTDFSFFGKLAFHFSAVILYEPLLKRRLHSSNNINFNGEADLKEYIATIISFREQGKISREFARKTLFLPYIHFGEFYLRNKKWTKGLNCFYKAWLSDPVSIIPIKKMAKTLVMSVRSL